MGNQTYENEVTPWYALAAAIIHRAVEDARGRCLNDEKSQVLKIQKEAYKFLNSDDALLHLIVALTGADPKHVLSTLRKRAGISGGKASARI